MYDLKKKEKELYDFAIIAIIRTAGSFSGESKRKRWEKAVAGEQKKVIKKYERDDLTFQGDAARIVRQFKEYSFTAEYSENNIHGVSTKIINMTMPYQVVVSYADFLDAGLTTVIVNTDESNLPMQIQKHGGYQLQFVANGAYTEKMEQEEQHLLEYDAIFMNPNCKSMMRNADNLITIVVNISREYLEQNHMVKYLKELTPNHWYDLDSKDAQYVVFHAKKSHSTDETLDETENAMENRSHTIRKKEDIEKLLYLLHNEMSKKMVGYEQIVPGLLQRLFDSLTSGKIYDTEYIMEKHFGDEDLAEQMRQYLNQNPKKITVEELTEIFHYNRNHLSEIFLKNTNQTIKQYNHRVCMKEARRLLTRTNLSVAAVAERLGFSSRSQFYKVYKEQFGCSPAESK